MQVLDGGVAHVSERSGVILRGVVVDSQRMAAAIERSLERVGIVRTHHRLDTDVVGQLHIPAAVGITTVYATGKVVPVSGIGDNERIIFGSAARNSEVHRDSETV